MNDVNINRVYFQPKLTQNNYSRKNPSSVLCKFITNDKL